MATDTIHPLTSLTSELKVLLQEDTDRRLREIINANINTRFAGTSPALADFRLAITNKDVQNDPTVLDDFRRLVSFTDYEDYRSLIAKFMERPCKLSEVDNLLTPGLPDFLCFSSSTSGKKPKLFPRRCQTLHFDMATLGYRETKVVAIYSVDHKGLVEVMTDSGETVHTVALSCSSSARARASMNWTVQTDDTRMTLMIPVHTAPWATGLIPHRRSFLLIHALFALAEPRVERMRLLFVTLFMDVIHLIQEDWELLLSSIQDGTIPDVEDIDHVRTYLQSHMRADPNRAEELRHIGPPLSCSGWAYRVWPALKTLICMCSGTFATALPKARAVLGPNITIHNPGYGCSEGLGGKYLNFGDSGEFFIEPKDIVEFLDVTDDQTNEEIDQAWDLQPGKLYQPVFTSRDGLWRYLIDDIFQAVGFHPHNGLPVFQFYARKNLGIRFHRSLITESDLMGVIRAINADGIVEVHEFTAALDDREFPSTVGFFLEINGEATSSNAGLLKAKSLEAFLAIHDNHQTLINNGVICPPTIRVVKSGTFMEYRRWKVDTMGVGMSQVKVPVVMWDSNALKWLTERVVREL